MGAYEEGMHGGFSSVTVFSPCLIIPDRHNDITVLYIIHSVAPYEVSHDSSLA